MGSIYRSVVQASWAAWVLFWLVCAADVKTALRREPLASRAIHFVPMLVAAALLVAPPRPDDLFLFARFVPQSAIVDLCGCTLVIAGLLFSIWARICLGRNWSGRVSVKENHELIRTGPYALVRHPIYTGLLVAILGTAWVVGQWRGLLAFLLMISSYWRKLRVEERLMLETFGDAYRRYCEHTAALVPFLL
jgi:protein-S-isoprenylcysteine O-methyltransferase Ste14